MKQCWYDVKFGCSAQNELTQLISFYIHFALKLAKVWWAFFQNKISRIEVFDLLISTYKQFLNSYVFGSWWAFNINHGQCPNYGGSHGVPGPLVILWGLLNAGLNRGSGTPVFYHETLRASWKLSDNLSTDHSWVYDAACCGANMVLISYQAEASWLHIEAK